MPAPAADPQDAGPASKADIALEQAAVVLAPLVRWLLRSGVNWVALSQSLKLICLDEGRRELQRSGARMTDSALSVLTGVHRKDVRALAGALPAGGRFTASPAARLAARWLAEADYHVDGHPSKPPLPRLPRHGPAPSFEALARDVSSDVHPHTLLEEMLRLGLASVEADEVVLAVAELTPDRHDRDAVAVVAANAADHLSAAVHNLTTGGPRHLEQAVFAHGLSEACAGELRQLARQLWRSAQQSMVDAASRHLQAGRPDGQAPTRMRFGIYYYEEKQDNQPPAPTTAEQPTQPGVTGRVKRARKAERRG